MKLQSLILILSAFLLFSCSSEEELTPEQKLVGSWEGSYFQETWGNSSIDVDISTLLVDQRVASGAYGPSDLSDCDPAIYICDNAGGCPFNWEFVSFTGGVFTFHETIPSGQNCIPGIITLSYITDDELSYKFVDEEDDTNVSIGSIARK